MADQNPFLLAANGPELDERLLPLLRSNTSLASQQDAHGYSLLHAAASYSHIDLLQSLVNEFKVDVNLRDEDNETCLFVAESLDVVKALVEELNVDASLTNNDGQTAREKFIAEEEYPEIAAYLSSGNAAVAELSRNPPPLPANVKVNIGTIANLGDNEPDPEFRRRIEELAARDDFQSESSQAQLRELISDAVRGVSDDQQSRQRRRVE